jgi:hypothetical protein
MKRFWLSWNAPAPLVFDLESPHYKVGEYHGGDVVVAAVKADDRQQAADVIYGAYDGHPGSLRFRSVQEMPAGWSPWDRPADAPDDWEPQFPREEWMVW